MKSFTPFSWGDWVLTLVVTGVVSVGFGYVMPPWFANMGGATMGMLVLFGRELVFHVRARGRHRLKWRERRRIAAQMKAGAERLDSVASEVDANMADMGFTRIDKETR